MRPTLPPRRARSVALVAIWLGSALAVAAALLAVQRGADIVRVHDVAATRDALAVLRAVDDEESFQS